MKINIKLPPKKRSKKMNKANNVNNRNNMIMTTMPTHQHQYATMIVKMRSQWGENKMNRR